MTTAAQLRQRNQLSINASLYGKRGGSVKSDRKKQALTESIAKAHLANRIKQAQRGTLFQVVGTDFMGNDRACRHYIKSNALKGAGNDPIDSPKIIQITVDKLRCMAIENPSLFS